jgi:hypothetical protein
MFWACIQINVLTCRESRGCSSASLSPRDQDLPGLSRRVRHIGGYLCDESPDRARGWQDVDVSIAGVCGDRTPEQRAAATAVQQQPRPEVSAFR